MTGRILDLFERSGDAHLGRTLIRLAHLAESVHRFEAASSLGGVGEDVYRVEADDPWPVDATPGAPTLSRAGAGAVHREVGR
ncbi:MAG: hypothetical protein V3U29_03740 [Phycisphaeraceae bacterium]